MGGVSSSWGWVSSRTNITVVGRSTLTNLSPWFLLESLWEGPNMRWQISGPKRKKSANAMCVDQTVSAGTIYRYSITQYPYQFVLINIDILFYPISNAYCNYWVHILHMCSSSFTYLWSVVWSESVRLCEPVLCVLLTSLIPIPPTTQYINISAIWSLQ